MLDPLLQSVRKSGISVTLHVDTPDPIPFEVISVVVVVAKEALTNASKHARPDEVAVDLRSVGGRHLLLTVSDDGTSTSDVAAGTGHGVNMCVDLAQEYGGSFAVTRESCGHVARLLLPLGLSPDENGSLSRVGSGSNNII
jgi:signal transduction histidine kinase